MSASTISPSPSVLAGAVATIGAMAVTWGLLKSASNNTPAFETVPLAIRSKLAEHLDKLSDENLIKVLRQLEFWASEGKKEDELLKVLDGLVAAYTREGFTCPTVRFGKTELQMPIVTCGGMRCQYTWVPDDMPIAPNAKSVLRGASQGNLKQIIRKCMSVGLNHFETARMYGTSELQFAAALKELMDEGAFKREDFILQTKIISCKTVEEFEQKWNLSWSIWKDTVGHIDLFAFHVPSSHRAVGRILDVEGGMWDFIKARQAEGKVKFLGFSSHGTSSNIMRMINSERFDYCNLHCHFFGDYHAEGTMNSATGTSDNKACVQRALELDMGVFQISPLDKGGMVYRPTPTVARACGTEMSPISFVMLHAWKNLGMHTTSVGVSKVADIDDALHAAYLYSLPETDALLKACADRLNAIKVEALGQEWVEKGMLNLPDCEEEAAQGMALGHIVWVHNNIKAFGMYEFGKERYTNLEGCPWSAKKSHEENMIGMAEGNMGRGYLPATEVDYSVLLKDHYNPDEVRSKVEECHQWLTKKTKFSPAQLQERGWACAYNLTVWKDHPVTDVPRVVLHAITGFGGGGKTKSFDQYASSVRESIASTSSSTK